MTAVHHEQLPAHSKFLGRLAIGIAANDARRTFARSASALLSFTVSKADCAAGPRPTQGPTQLAMWGK